MTKEEARIILLEQIVIQAQGTVHFLHGCLTDPNNYKYSYPDQTMKRLQEWNKVVPSPSFCYHSVFVRSCAACQEAKINRKAIVEAKALLKVI